MKRMLGIKGAMTGFGLVCIVLSVTMSCRDITEPEVEVHPLPSNPQQGTVWENSVGMKLVWIPPGTFQMGSNDHGTEKPVHTVTITKGFYMGVYEVTQEQYQKVMGTDPSVFKGDDLPVEMVSWYDAAEFCKKLCQKEGKTYRLPIEAEWEYACRAGTTTQYSYGDDVSQLGEYAWYENNNENTTHPVGAQKPNAWGLFDMHGNVWEWCQDWYGEYGGASVTDPPGPQTGDSHVFRGGCWYYAFPYCRVSYRNKGTLSYRSFGSGFRVVLDF